MKKKKIILKRFLISVFPSVCILFCALTWISQSSRGMTDKPLHKISSQNNNKDQIVFPTTWDVQGQKLFVFDPKQRGWAAYNARGIIIKGGPASGGRYYCEDIEAPCKTISGSFKVYSKGGSDCESGEFPIEKEDSSAGGAPMPYCMFFYRGYAIHGAYNVPRYNASHGCIRLFVDDAKWLNQNFIEIGTKVLVLPY